ncbi:MAG: hypothetical protein ACTFAK_14260 [Candidatus Electronema sp. VV]
MQDKANKFCTVSKQDNGDTVVKLYNIDDGKFIKEFFISKNDLPDEMFFIRFIRGSDNIMLLTLSFRESYRNDQFGYFDFYDTNIVVISDAGQTRVVHLGGLRKNSYSFEPVVFWRDGDKLSIWNIGNTQPVLFNNVNFADKDTLRTSDDLQRAVIWGPQRPAELWDVKEKKLLRRLTSSKDKHIQSVAFSMNDTAVVITEEGGVASLFDAKDGSPLAQHISVAEVYYYDPDLRRIHLWNSSGQVIRHVEGRSYFGWFVPTVSGADK